jgi:DNA-binding CsgD family transcriptional regulator
VHFLTAEPQFVHNKWEGEGGRYARRVLVGRTGLSPVMVGRAAELERLARLLASSVGTSVALIGGEPGVGKTRLVQELVARAGGVCSLVGQADPGALGRPFELLLDAVEGLADAHADLLGDVAEAGRPLDERVRSAHELVGRIVGAGPAVVVFEDLHWADSESVALFERLAEPANRRLLLVGTYRPEALSRRHPAADLLPRLERRRTVVHLRLDRLTTGDVGVFLGAVYGRQPSYRTVETLHARTGGNPFFLEELLSAAGEADVDDLCALPLPWSLAEVVRGQLAELSPETRRVAEAAAVLGRRVTFELLATVTRCTEDELIAILRELVTDGLMVETESDVFGFRHALAREAIEGGLLGRERRRLHQAAYEALREAGSDDLSSIAHHAEGAGRHDEMVEAARRGANDSLTRGSTYQALQLAELALTEAEDDIELLALAARAAWLAGLTEDAMAHAEEWLAQAKRAGDLEAESAALRRLVRLLWESDDIPAMDAATRQVESLSARLPIGVEQGRAMATIAQSYMLREQNDAAIEWAERAEALADTLDDRALGVWARAERGSALVAVPGRFEEGEALLVEVADSARRLGEYVIVARALNNLVRAHERRPEPDAARALLLRMREAAERAGFDSLAGASYWQSMAELAEWEGDQAGALDALAEGVRRDRGYLRSGKGAWYRVHEAGLRLERGEIEQADEVRAALAPGAAETKPLWYTGLVAHIACRRGDLPAARAALAEMVAIAAVRGEVEPQLAADVVAVALASGLGVADVRPLAALPLEGERRMVDAADPRRALVHALLLEAEGDRLEDALAGFEIALAGETLMRPHQLALGAVGGARVAIALGRTVEARGLAERAAALLARWPGWRREQLDAVERRLGIAAGSDGPEGLTPREREVAVLLAEGLSNAELARRLYISPKTAAVHVSNILAKLGMASRTEVAAWAIREGMSA